MVARLISVSPGQPERSSADSHAACARPVAKLADQRVNPFLSLNNFLPLFLLYDPIPLLGKCLVTLFWGLRHDLSLRKVPDPIAALPSSLGHNTGFVQHHTLVDTFEHIIHR